jgi:hypothetical protein
VLAAILGLSTLVIAVLIATPRVGLAGPACDMLVPAAAQNPVLGPWWDYRLDAVNNRAPAVAYNSARNEYLLVWEDHYASEIAIYGQRISGNGSPLGSAIQIAHYGTYTSSEPSVAYSPLHDEYLVAYANDTKPGGVPNVTYNILAQPINGDGTKTETGFVIGGNTNMQRHPAVTYNGSMDEFLVAWDEEQGTGGWHDVWAQRVRAADWSFPSGPVCIATGGNKHRYEPDVAFNAARNEYLIAYTREDTDPDVFGKVLGASLPNPLGVSETEIIYNLNLQGHVALAAGPDEYLAVFQDGPSASWRTIYARRVTGAGATPGVPFLIAERTGKVCAGPDVAYGPVFGYMVTWSCESTAGPEDTFGLYVRPGQDTPAITEFAIDEWPDSQIEPTIACSPSGDCLFAEADDSMDTDYEIYGRMVQAYHVYVPLVLRDFQ